MNLKQRRLQTLAYLREPQLPQTFEAYFDFGPKGDICAHCALGAIWYGLGGEAATVLSTKISDQVGLSEDELEEIIKWNDRDKLTLPEIASRLEARWSLQPQTGATPDA